MIPIWSPCAACSEEPAVSGSARPRAWRATAGEKAAHGRGRVRAGSAHTRAWRAASSPLEKMRRRPGNQLRRTSDVGGPGSGGKGRRLDPAEGEEAASQRDLSGDKNWRRKRHTGQLGRLGEAGEQRH